MRKSLEDLDKRYIIEHPDYAGLPEELKEYLYYILDSGYVIMAVPECLLKEAGDDLDMYECPVPVRYVLEKGYEIRDGHIIVNAPYDNMLGLDVPEEYTEYMTVKDMRKLSGLSRNEFCDKYRIPYRSLQDWELGARKPPEYVANLILQAVLADRG